MDRGDRSGRLTYSAVDADLRLRVRFVTSPLYCLTGKSPGNYGRASLERCATDQLFVGVLVAGRKRRSSATVSICYVIYVTPKIEPFGKDMI